jgi:hypothetical protein
MAQHIIQKREFDLEPYYRKLEEQRQQRIKEPLDYEKYKAIYAVYFKELTLEQYYFCHGNGIQWRIERGYDIDINGDWDKQPITYGIGTKRIKK